jgi:pyruvate dehydrogenase E2 component (dihydrolipoamide acetyltransferase)
MGERVFALPDLGEGLEEAVVAAWLVAEGDAVELNQPIAEIETAKAVVEMPSPFAGRIARLHAATGATVTVGAPLVTFEVPGGEQTVSGAPEGERDESPGGVALPPPPPTAARRPGVAATPAVRRLAKDLGVDLESLTGSGPEGRITREDVERTAARSVAPSSGREVGTVGERLAAWTEGADTDPEEIALSSIRRSAAERLSEAAAIPQVTTFRTVDAAALDEVRRALSISPLPLFVRALVDVLRVHPMLNASWATDRILRHRRVNVGVAVDTERGLVVPVVHDAASLGVGALAAEIERLAGAAREGSLRAPDLAGATIAVSNTGSYGSEYGTPLLNPGHAVTVALGAIRPRALVVDDRVEARPACTISLTFDHRVLDGATVGRALSALVDLLESRERLDALPR